ncbi:DNA fragmentation factor subunit beta isoform X3 [Macaca nemestrina]|uniref:DNA fragmentation factor subunit beta isoform X3 n=1 Tax=Macaca nemestrina TaxID=9545 RepID=UPI0005F44F37|nr:DNA fragmentation factor subunit beta isoform X3 [Macaca nemestrina]
MLQKPKSVKLRALRSPRKFGVAGRSCQEVLRKGCLRFQLPERGSRLCLYEDGTELTEDYFPSVPDNAELVLLTSGQAWQGCLESRFQNKSGYLRYSCESRIRSYLREVSSYPSLVGAEAQEEFLRVLGSMCQKLRSVQYNGSYFDRGAKGGGRLCTPEGWFSCQGPFDMDSCLSRHSINPYSNRESRILFSTWNLDHIIEKKRTIIPTLVEAIKEQDGREVDWEYFYGLLFTSENLKLVHIVCHKKTIHKLNCDPNRIYKPQPRLKRKRPMRKR